MSDDLPLDDLLTQIALTEVMGRTLEATREGSLPCESVNFETQWSALLHADGVAFEIRDRLELTGIGPSHIATLSAGATVLFSMKDASRLEESDGAIAQLAGFAVLVAHPYLRAAISQLASGIGLPSITLGLLRVGAAHPDTVTVLDRVFSLDAAAEGPRD